jgi:hypothetical protein
MRSVAGRLQSIGGSERVEQRFSARLETELPRQRTDFRLA